MTSNTKVKQIKITTGNSDFLKIKIGFNKRWNIKDEDENKTHLKNRCLAVINNYLNNIYEYYARKATIDEFCSEVEMFLGISTNSNNWDKFDNLR